jgi:uncharacterized protein YidB (DUF937 family)
MVSRNMTALLAMLALAGWQNRDRLSEMLGKIAGPTPGDPSVRPGGGASPDPTGAATAGSGGLGDLLGGIFGSGSSGRGVSGGLGELIDSFARAGKGDVADSWVQTGPNKDVAEPQLADALGADTLDELAQQTGLSKDELLSRLKAVLPTAVDKLTPQGRLPTEEEASRW